MNLLAKLQARHNRMMAKPTENAKNSPWKTTPITFKPRDWADITLIAFFSERTKKIGNIRQA